ncbi:MAG: omega-amidase [Saprospiraceae bacterium]|jgi:omega-amidase
MSDLTITLIQSTLHWQDPEANRKMFGEKIKNGDEPKDLVILPEMFTTGFTMNAREWAETMEGPTLRWMKRVAEETDAVITGSLIISEDGNYYNRLIWMRPDGTFDTYDKRHLFAMAGEHEHYAPGTERLIVTLHGWKICPLICYDLRFPVWARNDDAYDLLIYMANWPDRRSYDWNTLLRARAIENQTFVAAVNRVGTDGNEHAYAGDSCVIDPGWEKTIHHMEDKDAVATVVLSYKHLQDVRGKLPFLKDADKFSVEQ